jgi:hypothetical protein
LKSVAIHLKKTTYTFAMATKAYSKVPAHEQEQELVGQGDEDEDGRLTTDVPSLQNEEHPNVPLELAQSDTSLESIDLLCSVDEAIERLGMGRFQLVVLTAAGFCFAADAMQVLLLTFLSEVLRSEWSLDNNETALIISMLFIGAIFGTLTLGPLADKKGRKPVFLLAASIISFFGVAVAFVNSYRALLANLFMVGWGVGGLTGELLYLPRFFLYLALEV